MILTSRRCVEHPFAGQNTQQPGAVLETRSCFLPGLGPQRRSVLSDRRRNGKGSRYQCKLSDQLTLRRHCRFRRRHGDVPDDPHRRTHHHILPLDEDQDH